MRTRKVAPILTLLLGGWASAQSLEEAARREKERQKAVEQASSVKSFTEKDLADNRGQLASDPKAAPRPAGAPPSGEEDRTRERAEWKSRLDAAESRLERAKKRYASLKDRVVLPRAGGYYPAESAEDQATRAKEELDKAQQALDDLLEEARRTNIPPGWLRS